jgi:hypothetical protein
MERSKQGRGGVNDAFGDLDLALAVDVVSASIRALGRADVVACATTRRTPRREGHDVKAAVPG